MKNDLQQKREFLIKNTLNQTYDNDLSDDCKEQINSPQINKKQKIKYLEQQNMIQQQQIQILIKKEQLLLKKQAIEIQRYHQKFDQEIQANKLLTQGMIKKQQVIDFYENKNYNSNIEKLGEGFLTKIENNLNQILDKIKFIKLKKNVSNFSLSQTAVDQTIIMNAINKLKNYEKQSKDQIYFPPFFYTQDDDNQIMNDINQQFDNFYTSNKRESQQFSTFQNYFNLQKKEQDIIDSQMLEFQNQFSVFQEQIIKIQNNINCETDNTSILQSTQNFQEPYHNYLYQYKDIEKSVCSRSDYKNDNQDFDQYHKSEFSPFKNIINKIQSEKQFYTQNNSKIKFAKNIYQDYL